MQSILGIIPVQLCPSQCCAATTCWTRSAPHGMWHALTGLEQTRYALRTLECHVHSISFLVEYCTPVSDPLRKPANFTSLTVNCVTMSPTALGDEDTSKSGMQVHHSQSYPRGLCRWTHLAWTCPAVAPPPLSPCSGIASVQCAAWASLDCWPELSWQERSPPQFKVGGFSIGQAAPEYHADLVTTPSGFIEIEFYFILLEEPRNLESKIARAD